MMLFKNCLLEIPLFSRPVGTVKSASIGKLGVVSHFLKCARSDVREQLMLVNKYTP